MKAAFFVAAGVFTGLIAAGYVIDSPLAMWTWPWAIGKLGRIFLASILLAIAVPVVQIGLSREWAATRGGAINLLAMFAVMSAYSFTRVQSEKFLWFGVVTGLFALFQIGVWAWSLQFHFRDRRATPPAVRWSFLLFALILILVGGALCFGNNVLPWPVDTKFAPLYGAIYLGASLYFLYGLINPIWGNARGQLAGFLAYDLVLIYPFAAHLVNVPDNMRASLLVYIAVLVYSGFLATFYLWRGPRAFGR